MVTVGTVFALDDPNARSYSRYRADREPAAPSQNVQETWKMQQMQYAAPGVAPGTGLACSRRPG